MGRSEGGAESPSAVRTHLSLLIFIIGRAEGEEGREWEQRDEKGGKVRKSDNLLIIVIRRRAFQLTSV